MTLVKICGIRELDHALAALEAGADMIGFVFAESRRRVDPGDAAGMVARCREQFPTTQRQWKAVGVFANQPDELVARIADEAAMDAVQLSGAEPVGSCRTLALPLFKTLHLPPRITATEAQTRGYGEDVRSQLAAHTRAWTGTVTVLDMRRDSAWGGTGETFDWAAVGIAAACCLVAGGLSTDNVAAAMTAMTPWGVDVSSGVEEAGRKSPALIRRFIQEVRTVDGHRNN